VLIACDPGLDLSSAMARGRAVRVSTAGLGTARTMYLLIPQICCHPDSDLVLLERLPHQRRHQIRVLRLQRPAREVENAVIVLHQHPARLGTQQLPVHLRNLQASRNRRLVPPVLNLGNGNHPPTIASQQAPHWKARRK